MCDQGLLNHGRGLTNELGRVFVCEIMPTQNIHLLVNIHIFVTDKKFLHHGFIFLLNIFVILLCLLTLL